jgi:ubiquinone/menaquinone biosynthesis C-methylase UbiE
MNWHETIEYIRQDPAYKELVREAYFSSDLKSNIESFRNSAEFRETFELIKSLNSKNNLSILDIGAGNGISSVALALEGMNVVALEPDPSDSIGAGAIEKMKLEYQLDNLKIIICFGEDMPFDDESFDIVYARQTMHHASNLEKFTKSIYRVLKPNGILITTRDHVITNNDDKELFLKKHPLQKFYGGENAYTLQEYKHALISAGLKLYKILGPTDSIINYSPWSKDRLAILLKNKFGKWAVNSFLLNVGWSFILYRQNKLPGRLYSFISTK